ncbi:MAG: hypothetical protein SVX38_08015 [Chloroflexota bacterium]|nr:hypothetical protein [Chloroflexota bacterium]
MGPIWAVLCGAVASGGLLARWKAVPALLLAAFVADPLWGALWVLVAEADWLLVLDGRRLPAQGERVPALPYTASDSPARRFALWLGQVLIWVREDFAPRLGGHTASLLVLLPILAVLSTALGRQSTALSLAALGVAVWALLSRSPDQPPSQWLRAVMEMGLPWLLGHVTLATFTSRSALVALGFTIAYGAALGLPVSVGRRALLLLNGGQMATLALLVLWRQPVAATVGGLLLLAQTVAQTHLGDSPTRVGWYLRWTQPLLLAGMLVAALAV